MPFCPTCGTSADGKFCPKCGAAMGAPAGAPPPPPPPGYQQPGYQQQNYQQGYQAPPQPISAPGLSSNIAAMLCYIVPVICPIVFLVVEPYKSDRKVRFDAFQSIFLWLAFVGLHIVCAIMASISYHLWFLYSILSLVEFGVSVLLAIKAYQGERFMLPVIGDLAAKQS